MFDVKYVFEIIRINVENIFALIAWICEHAINNTFYWMRVLNILFTSAEQSS
jgi:hypothetical protein